MPLVPSLDVFYRARRDDRRVVVLTAYDAPTARLAARGGVDALLVGDSLGQVVLGHDTTLPVSVGDMLHHTRAVVRAATGLPVITDMPYGSFHVDPRQTVKAALKLVQRGGAQAVKLEGGRQRADHLAAVLAAEIPVMGHVGLTPQSLHRFGGYRVQGRGEEASEALLEEARFLDEAGCFAIVLECVPAALAARITEAVSVPTIGIGAGASCDGQVLVFHDLLGLSGDFQPRFVKRYAELGKDAEAAIGSFVDEVRRGAFPAAEHVYGESKGKGKGGAKKSDADPAAKEESGGYLGGAEGEEG